MQRPSAAGITFIFLLHLHQSRAWFSPHKNMSTFIFFPFSLCHRLQTLTPSCSPPSIYHVHTNSPFVDNCLYNLEEHKRVNEKKKEGDKPLTWADPFLLWRRTNCSWITWQKRETKRAPVRPSLQQSTFGLWTSYACSLPHKLFLFAQPRAFFFFFFFANLLDPSFRAR